ncbi:unnamed protein product [Cylindrotheca closterium]|uniref:Calcium/calmodulin-dependent protein kinase II association-domain domain-containing protein n=1 Tax=Cylindrotheca closterium TaxID=2856 RepID=A0AAD2JN80_9STRA|nr:unnamed protein product [Cylindrotheca closterium]
MKLSTGALILAFAAAVEGFAPLPQPALSLSQTASTSTTLYAAGKRKRNKRPKAKKQQADVAVADSVISQAEVRSLFSLWNSALATGDSRIVAQRYAKDPILLPTVSDVPRCDYDSIKDYFDNFLKMEPQGQILQGDIRIGADWAQDCGIYEFTMGATGDKVKARYTYTYVYEDKQWKIAHHHSSVMPENLYISKEINVEEVRGLFQLWNSALATLDSKAVASRYAKNACLLPTVSDIPRTDEAGIVDYFDNFLKMKPQGEILESNVLIGDNWCQDTGIYEFTMGASGAVVKGRYSFVYQWEDGQWKIAHHHSSVMPEEQLAKANAGASKASSKPTDSEVRSLFHLWNDALATLDPETVAKRYSKSPCLLPTVSDLPRTDHESIKDYFVNFLKLEPQGVILESYVTAGDDWCMDDGIYEFTMGATGAVVKARYSFVYAKEGDAWKIVHHHSSQMPEEVVAKASIKKEEVAVA